MKIVKKNNRRFLVTRLCPFRGGFAFFFCIVVRHEGETERNPNLINHECIHFRQQRELLWIPFILIYFFHAVYIVTTTWSWEKIWEDVCFEREAYENEHNHEYLKVRRRFASLQSKYFRQKT